MLRVMLLTLLAVVAGPPTVLPSRNSAAGPPAQAPAPAPAPKPEPKPAPPPKPADPAPAPALALPKPQTVEPGSGYLKIVPAATGPVSFDLFAAWDDGTTAVQAEAIGGVLVIGIPSKEGVLRITAALSITGKPPLLASTTVTVQGKDKPPEKSSGGGLPPVAPGPLVHVTTVGLPDSAGLRTLLGGVGAKYWPLDSAALGKRADMQRVVRDNPGTGGIVVVQDAAGKVLVAARVVDEGGVVQAVNRSRGK